MSQISVYEQWLSSHMSNWFGDDHPEALLRFHWRRLSSLQSVPAHVHLDLQPPPVVCSSHVRQGLCWWFLICCYGSFHFSSDLLCLGFLFLVIRFAVLIPACFPVSMSSLSHSLTPFALWFYARSWHIHPLDAGRVWSSYRLTYANRHSRRPSSLPSLYLCVSDIEK